jgi:hypothetical protein
VEANEFDGHCPWCGIGVQMMITESSTRIQLTNCTIDEIGENKVYTCGALGVAGVTPVVVRKTAEGFSARVGIAIMGSMNFPQLEGCNPFDPNYHDNYCQGHGKTEKEALDALLKDVKHMSETLFA